MFMIILLLLLYFFVFAQPTYAYLDPGTGSYVTQLMIGFLAGGLYLLKVYWQKLVSIFRRLFRKPKMINEKEKNNKRS